MAFYIKSKPAGLENMGTPWREPELLQLLKEIKDKMPYDDIAKLHKRTSGGITSRLRQLAYDYYTEEKSISEIMAITGLSKDDVVDAITKREYNDQKKAEKKGEKNKIAPVKESAILAVTPKPKTELSELQEILKVLKGLESRVSEYIKERSIFDE